MEDPGEVPQSGELDRGAVKKCGSEAKDKNKFLVTEVLQLSDWIRGSPFIYFFSLCTRVRLFLATDNSLSNPVVLCQLHTGSYSTWLRVSSLRRSLGT